MPNNKESAPFDAGYKLLFSNPKIVQDLLEGFVKPEWIDMRQLRELMTQPGYRPMQRSVAIWLNRLLRVRVKDEAIPELHNLNEVDAMLSEKLADWTEQWKQEGLEAGLEAGLEQGLAKGLERGEAKRSGLFAEAFRKTLWPPG
ncbi:hypothetical protein [Marinimicrobium locisalis]|uniref:hypothetical protein n=1 Tax=Marinimicrobium locisalis TaxID=546022 RepID=UPI003221EFB2